MRIKAKESDVAKLMEHLPKSGYFCFPEQRDHELRSPDILPERWVKMSPEQMKFYKGTVQPGEFFIYQIGLYPVNKDLKNVKVAFSDLKNESGDIISAKEMECFNTGGVDIYGKDFTKEVNVDKGKLQAFWMGAPMPEKAKGIYKGTVTVTPENADPMDINVELTVKGKVVANHGDDEGWRRSRLRWLNSRIGEGSKPTAPFTPVSVKGNRIAYLGGALELDALGLPKQITTFYNSFNTLKPQGKNEVLDGGMKFIIETSKGIETLKPQGCKVSKNTAGRASWTANSTGENVSVTCEGWMEFDGFSNVSVKVKANKDIDVKDIRLECPYTEVASTYFMGLGHRGGARPEEVRWKWDLQNRQDVFWMGGVNAGLRMLFKSDNYRRPLLNVYYKYGQLNMPPSWGNNGSGGIDIEKPSSNGSVMVKAYSGERKMTAGESVDFGMELMITPVRPTDWKQQVAERFYHSNSNSSEQYIAQAKKNGANIINIHHKKDIYPYINYPYYDVTVGDFKKFVDDAHAEGVKVKTYYTTREISVKMPEVWIARSLGSELIMDGPGKNSSTVVNPKGGHAWLAENFKDHYIPAWHNRIGSGKCAGDTDLSVITTPDSRWNNYFLEGLDWMVKKMGIDGIYVDDSALDRETFKRARRILDADGKRRIVDLHTCNHMNGLFGHANSLLMYVDLLPYMDRLWIGEGFGAVNTPEFWLVEMSGIPFGLYSETLNAPNYWRGMAFGMTPRLGWSGNPVPLWKLFDDFAIQDSQMIGFWNKANPVTADSSDVKTTVYLKEKTGEALVVLANWTGEPVSCKLNIDTEKLGFTPSRMSLPEMKGVQEGAENLDIKGSYELKGNQGLFILLKK